MAIRLAVFDLDGTLLVGSKTVMPVLASQIWRAGFRRPAGAARFALAGGAALLRKARLISWEQFTEYGTKLILGWMAGLTPAAAAPYFDAAAGRLLASLRPSTRAEIDRLAAAGYRPVILSATVQPFLEAIARPLGCAAVGTPVRLDAQGRITGALAGPFCSGPAKLAALQAWAGGLGEPVDWAGSSAYGDTLPDLPMLEAVGTPVAVAPEPPLAAVARERGWRLLAD